ncbi:MAG: hypothetical protein VSS52_013655, partial [Thiotrichaceae bacterium]|nr:hypothetical protein [Thiotrichaceae bacterium]
DIQISHAQLALAPEKTLSFIGGNININASELIASSGQLNLVSIAQQGELSITDFETSEFHKQAAISLFEKTKLDVSGLHSGNVLIRGERLISQNSIIQADAYGFQQGGGIDIKLTQSALFQGDNIAISMNNFGQGSAGYLNIDVPNVDIVGSIISAGNFGAGQAGNISIKAQHIMLQAGASIRSDTYATQQGGKIDISASDSLTVEGYRSGNMTLFGGLILEDYPSEITTNTYGSGQAGIIDIKTNQLLLNGGFIACTTFGSAPAGDLLIQANKATLLNGASISSSSIVQGLGGNIDMTIDDSLSVVGQRLGSFRIRLGEQLFEYKNNQSVIAAAALGIGDGGHISITAPHIFIDGGGMIATSTTDTGHAGDIDITVDHLQLTRGGQINNSSGGRIGTELIIGTGFGGLTKITANRITASGVNSYGIPSGIVSNTLGVGNGGDIFIDTQYLDLAQQGTVATNSFASGNAGNIYIDASQIHLAQQGRITSAATQAIGGNINIDVSHLLNLQQGQITTSVHGGEGNSGDIIIQQPQFIVLKQAQIIAQADEGQGGNIQIVADQLLSSPNSLISASSRLGLDGDINITSPDETISGGLFILNKKFAEQTQIKDVCKTAVAGQKTTEFQAPLTLKVDMYRFPSNFIESWIPSISNRLQPVSCR